MAALPRLHGIRRTCCRWGCHPALVAGLLPCFWVYDDVGRRLQHQVGDTSRHPYGDWVDTYGDPASTASTVAARTILDRVAEQVGEPARAGT